MARPKRFEWAYMSVCLTVEERDELNRRWKELGYPSRNALVRAKIQEVLDADEEP